MQKYVVSCETDPITVGQCTRSRWRRWVRLEACRPECRSSLASDREGTADCESTAVCGSGNENGRTATKASFMAEQSGQHDETALELVAALRRLTGHFIHVLQEDVVLDHFLQGRSGELEDLFQVSERLPLPRIRSCRCADVGRSPLTVAALISPIPTCPLQNTRPGTLTAGPVRLS